MALDKGNRASTARRLQYPDCGRSPAFFRIILIGILMMPPILFATPHEPSPAGGGWLELNPKLGQVQTDASWLPELTGTLTIEAWIYVDETLPKQVTFSLVGQTDRFSCFMPRK